MTEPIPPANADPSNNRIHMSDYLSRSRYEISVGDKPAGFIQYTDEDGVRSLTHTEVFDEWTGKGLAKQLIGYALDTIREEEMQVLPVCPAVAGYIKKNPDYLDLVPQDRRGDFDLG